MFMTAVQLPQIPVRTGRIIALIVAASMLNVGLYFLLYIFTPLISGLIVGFLVARPKEGGFTSFFGSLLSFFPMLLISAPSFIDYLISTGQLIASEVPALLPWIYFQLVISGLILSIIGLIGGIVGGYLGRRARL